MLHTFLNGNYIQHNTAVVKIRKSFLLYFLYIQYIYDISYRFFNILYVGTTV